MKIFQWPKIDGQGLRTRRCPSSLSFYLLFYLNSSSCSSIPRYLEPGKFDRIFHSYTLPAHRPFDKENNNFFRRADYATSIVFSHRYTFYDIYIYIFIYIYIYISAFFFLKRYRENVFTRLDLADFVIR